MSLPCRLQSFTIFSQFSKAYENKPIGVEEPGRLTVALGVLIFRELAEIVGDFPAGFAILTRFFFVTGFFPSFLFIYYLFQKPSQTGRAPK